MSPRGRALGQRSRRRWSRRHTACPRSLQPIQHVRQLRVDDIALVHKSQFFHDAPRGAVMWQRVRRQRLDRQSLEDEPHDRLSYFSRQSLAPPIRTKRVRQLDLFAAFNHHSAHAGTAYEAIAVPGAQRPQAKVMSAPMLQTALQHLTRLLFGKDAAVDRQPRHDLSVLMQGMKIRKIVDAQAAPCQALGRKFLDHGSFSRVFLTIATYCRARSRMRAKSRAATASGRTSWRPTPRQHAPALRNAAAVVRSTPPVGIRRICGSGPRTALKKAGPTTSAGKILTMSAPASQAVRISVGVKAPGITSLS